MRPPAPFSRRAFLGGALAAGLSALTLTGCSTNAFSGKSRTITVMTVANEVTDELLASWEAAYPDIGLSFITFDQIRLNSMIAAGNPPDVVRATGASQSAYYAARGISHPLDDYLRASSVLRLDDLAAVNDVWRWDGTTQGAGAYYGITKDWSQDLMYWVNTRMLEEAGLPLPTDDAPLSHADLLEYGKEMTFRSGGKVTQYGLFQTTPRIAGISTMVASAGGSVYNDDLTEIDLTSPEARQALQWYVDVAAARIGYTLVDVSPEGWDWPGFSAQRLAMDGAGYWMTGQITPDQEVEPYARLCAAPMMGRTRVSPTTAATGFWISAKSSMKDEAFAFVEWFCGGEPAAQRATTGWGIPTVDSLVERLPQETELQKAAYATQVNEQKYLSVVPASPFIDATAIDASLADAFARAVRGDISVGQWADSATDSVNALLRTGASLVGK
ncbi:extracellular solute-binding protein [Microbacterium gilvum]|uniref:ABC transporter substrate-binding protein n=1 Tax=Microbacterium gilvum TaxID=1336204 RepID=A0ABP9ADP6_9MICO